MASNSDMRKVAFVLACGVAFAALVIVLRHPPNHGIDSRPLAQTRTDSTEIRGTPLKGYQSEPVTESVRQAIEGLRSAKDPNGARDCESRLTEYFKALGTSNAVSEIVRVLNSGVDVPTLIVVGEEDVLTPPKESHAMNERIPGSRVEVIAQAGHLSNMERRAAFTSFSAEEV